MADLILTCLIGMGRMGQELKKLMEGDKAFGKIVTVDPATPADFSDLAIVPLNSFDALIDFSKPEASIYSAQVCADFGIPLIIGTTGLSKEQEDEIRKYSLKTAIFRSKNMSLGVNFLKSVMPLFGKALPWHIDIIEGHHSGKLDAPSGTAQILADELALVQGYKVVYGVPEGKSEMPRDPGVIVVHSFRAGTIPGEHEIIFSGPGEEIRVIHRAYSRELFARGAVQAIKWIIGKPPGLYSMKDVLGL